MSCIMGCLYCFGMDRITPHSFIFIIGTMTERIKTGISCISYATLQQCRMLFEISFVLPKVLLDEKTYLHKLLIGKLFMVGFPPDCTSNVNQLWGQ